MEKNKNISTEALEGVEKHVKPEEEGDDDDEDDEKFDDENEQVQLGELVSSITPVIATDSKVIELETLAVPENDIQSGFITSSHHLSEVPVEHTLQPHESAGIKSQVRVSQQQALVSVMTQTDQLHLLNHLQLPGCQTSALELSPTSVTQSILFVPSPTLQEQRVSPLANSNGMFVAEVNQKKFSDSKIVSAAPVVKASSVDGYNWRKYGQKQVKSPQGFRSYYKCTYSECYAKKIECCDSSSSVTEIIYKSHHNHDPPPKINCATEKRLALSVVPIVGSTNTSNPVGTLSSKDPATSSGESIEKKIPITKTKQQFSSGTDGNDQMNDAEEHVNKPESKRRVKKSSSVYTDPVCTSSKKPKFVVHAAGDVGISGDGYRWRKYGQKVVKGTPHPRNYY